MSFEKALRRLPAFFKGFQSPRCREDLPESELGFAGGGHGDTISVGLGELLISDELGGYTGTNAVEKDQHHWPPTL